MTMGWRNLWDIMDKAAKGDASTFSVIKNAMAKNPGLVELYGGILPRRL